MYGYGSAATGRAGRLGGSGERSVSRRTPVTPRNSIYIYMIMLSTCASLSLLGAQTKAVPRPGEGRSGLPVPDIGRLGPQLDDE